MREELTFANCFGKETIPVGSYCKRDHEFKSSQFAFDMNTCSAYSYDWWQFVKRVGNTIYFNNARYSMQTDLHQNMAWNILICERPELYGIKVKTVYYREGLNHLDSAIRNLEYQIKELKEAIARPRSRKKTNADRIKRIESLKAEIKEVIELIKVFNKGE